MSNIDEVLSASQEDYLEAIFHIEAQKHAARAKDIADRLNVSRASVTGALRTLAGKELVNYTPYDLITLTPKGKTVAEDIVLRHTTLRDFFVKVLALNEESADEAACKIEHNISGVVMDRLTRFIEFLENCPRGGEEWLEGFGKTCKHGKDHTQCKNCLADLIEEFKSR